MQYTDELADETIQKFNLDPKTKRVWKNRGSIPDRYSSDNYQKPAEPGKKETVIMKRIIDVLSLPIVNSKLLCELANVSSQKVSDVKRGKTESLSEREIIALKSEINKIKIQIAKTFETKSMARLNELEKSEIILLRPVIGQAGGSMIDYDRAARFRRGEYMLTDSDYALIKDAYIKAAFMLAV